MRGIFTERWKNSKKTAEDSSQIQSDTETAGLIKPSSIFIFATTIL